MSKNVHPLNAPCPCGSGKKYKVCCLKKEQAGTETENTRKRIRRVGEELAGKLLQFSASMVNKKDLRRIWRMYTEDRENQPFKENSPTSNSFFSWFLYNWRPRLWIDEFDPLFDTLGAVPSTFAELYLEKYKLRLTDTEKRSIQISCSGVFSFHEVLESHPGKGLRLRDILLGTELYVHELSASQSLQAGNIVYAKVIQMDGISLFAGLGALPITPAYKIQIIEFRENIEKSIKKTITGAHLSTLEIDLRHLYFDIYDRITTLPEIRNTDGDSLVFSTLHYKIASPQPAFEKLKHLAAPMHSETELLEQAEFDTDNNLSKIKFPWIKIQRSGPRKNELILMGEITIDGTELSVYVNSEERAKKIKAEIKKHLGKEAQFRSAQIKSIDEALEEKEPTPLPGTAQEELPEAEMQEIMDQYLESYWEKWPNEKIPALNNQTPVEAVKSLTGREKVNALLDDMERNTHNGTKDSPQLKYIKRTRKQLGLAK